MVITVRDAALYSGSLFNIPLRAGVLIIAVSIFTINYIGSMRWLQNINNDWYYVETQAKTIASKNDLVIVEDAWILKYYLRYYTQVYAFSSDEKDR